ncbi:hypothetical protein [Veronia pacifica]|uniref:Uncharacterized protein n=1 Tax=Veronia pacifica TaxID=1080227 RepID=A0A1C3EPB7_9GAMM|nr:hypothetical protein [Veronia pacifica]ODA35071.1 hypothetical protein A8L45_05170 [Veronia pacifica]
MYKSSNIKSGLGFFINNLLAYSSVGVLASGIPFSFFGMTFGFIPVVIASITMAAIRTAEYRKKTFPAMNWKPWLIGLAVLLLANIVVAIIG